MASLNHDILNSFDYEGVMLRLGGSFELFEELLLNFYSENRGGYEQYLDLKSKGDHEGRRILIHSFKGISGNLGMEKLHLASAELETSIKENNPDLEEELTLPFQTELSVVVSILEDAGIVSLRDEAPSGKEIDSSELKKLIIEFEGHARIRKAKPSNEVIAVLRSSSVPALYSSQVDEIIGLAKKYKLKEAADKAFALIKCL